MTAELSPETLDLLKKQLRVQRRVFAIQLVLTIAMGILLSMVLVTWMYAV